MKKFHLLLTTFALASLLLFIILSSPSETIVGAASFHSTAPNAALSASQTYTDFLPLALYDVYSCPETPTLLAPPDGSTLDTIIPLFRWNGGHPIYAHLLQLQISKYADFRTLDRSMNTTVVEGERFFRFPSNFEPGTTYYWRTHIICENRVQGPYSEVWSLTTGLGGVILPAPTLLSPANGIATESRRVTFEWEPVPEATRYIIHYRPAGTGGSVYHWVTRPSLTATVRADTTYEWWVAAVNDYAIGEDSEYWRFTTPADSP